MKGKELMRMVDDARSNWHGEAEDLASDAVRNLEMAAVKGDTSTRFSFGERNAANRNVVRIARSILREDGINLAYSAGRCGREFTASINQRLVADYDDNC